MDRCLSIALLAFAVLGCEKRYASLPPGRIDTSTPEGQFEWVMQRLERTVLDTGWGDRSAGLRIANREIKHDLFPPTSEKSHYTASVTITSVKGYVPEEPLQLIDEEKVMKKRRREIKRIKERAGFEDPDEGEFDPLASKFQSQMDELAARHQGPTRRLETLDTPTTKEEKIYELAFRDGRWELETEVQTEHERLWFEYALQSRIQ